MAGVPITEGLFVEGPPARLIGGVHRETGRIVFPLPEGSEGRNYEPRMLSPTGSVWSWTVQRFRPKSPPYAGPEEFTPFVMAYVELPGEVIVASRLVDVSSEDVRVGMAVETVIVPLDPAALEPKLLPAFRPLRKAVP